MNYSVRFDDSSTQTILVGELCESLIDSNAFWYSRRDFESFRQKNLYWCNQRDQRNRKHVRGILSQQMEHKDLGIDDPKGLKQLSMACSKPSRQRAREQALLNSKEVDGPLFQETDLERTDCRSIRCLPPFEVSLLSSVEIIEQML